jgi:phosphatidylserine decarboxylase
MILKEGYPFILISSLMVAPFLYFFYPWGALALLLPAYVVLFFRNPKRTIPTEPKTILSPADGRVLSIEELDESRYLNHRVKRVCIFMSPVDVHANRIPISGKIKDVFYNHGKYFSAFKEKASLDNEQNAVLMESQEGHDILFVQIAGFLARRIVCYLKKGDQVTQGERYGLIRFGSRMDVYMPKEFEFAVKVGEYAKGGETILARFS